MIKHKNAALALAISKAVKQIKPCNTCFALIDIDQCDYCYQYRQNDQICVVEEPHNVFSIEKSGVFQGLYHVLEGTLAPMRGIGIEDLRIKELHARINKNPVQELIIATNPTIEGEATAHYLIEEFKDTIPKISRLAIGMPSGSDLEYSDSNTILHAFENRQQHNHDSL